LTNSEKGVQPILNEENETKIHEATTNDRSIIVGPHCTIMPKAGDLWVGIMMVVTGLYTLAWMPILKKRLAKRQELGERTDDQVRGELKKMKLVIICSLFVGGGLICIYAFNLYDPGR